LLALKWLWKNAEGGRRERGGEKIRKEGVSAK